MPKAKHELKHLALDIARPFFAEFLETDYLHYGYWDRGLEVKFSNIKKAQERFVEILEEHIHENVKEVLDVGCGTGEVAKTLVEKRGFSVDCVSPSPSLNEIAQKKLKNSGRVFTGFFQEIQLAKQYDLVLFSESFQYVPTLEALSKARSCLKEGGEVLICDFFKLPSDKKSPIGGGHDLAAFHAALKNSGFEVVADKDITPFMAPTIDLRERLMKNLVLPLSKNLDFYLQAKASFTWKWIKKVFAKKIAAKKKKYLEEEVNAEVFSRFKSYRLILLRKTER